MSEILPTVKVKIKESGNEVIVNKSDFDPKLQELLEDNSPTEIAPVAPPADMTVAQIKARLDDLKVDYSAATKKADYQALLLDAETKLADSSAPAMRVEAKGDKFVILNAANVQQGEEFATEQAAQDMITLLGGNK